MKPTVKCPECYSSELYKYGKDKLSNQKYLCKMCKRKFTQKSGKKNIKSYPKCPIYRKGMYFHLKYKYHVSFKYNYKKCNHTINNLNLELSLILHLKTFLVKILFSSHRFSVNTIIPLLIYTMLLILQHEQFQHICQIT